MEQVSIRLTDQQIEQIDKLAKQNGITRSEQVRESVGTFLSMADRIENGEYLTLLPRIEPDYLDVTLEEAGMILEDIDHEDYNYFKTVIPRIINALKFDVGVQLMDQNKEDAIDFGQDYVKSDIRCHLYALEQLTKQTRG